MRIMSFEYDNKQLVNLNDNETLLSEVLNFKREVLKRDKESLIHYHEINNNVDILNVLRDDKLVCIFHQDSERDVFILFE